MKILILTSSNPYISAGIVALDLYKGLTEIEGNQVRMLVGTWGEYEDVNIISFDSKSRFILKKYFKKLNILKKMLLKFFGYKEQKTDTNYSIQDFDQTTTYHSTQKILNKIHFVPDRIIVLFMQKFLSFKNLYELNNITKAPIYLYMMDMAPMTGGCHYAWNCNGYKNKCGSCIGMFSKIDDDQSRKNWLYKKKYTDLAEITLVACTEFQYRQLEQSALYKNKTKRKILLSIDSEAFKPEDKKKARRILNLPFDKKVIFFGAVGVNTRRKGFVELVEALKHYKLKYDQNNIHILIAGRTNDELISNIPYSYTSLGYLNHSSLANAFQAADIFVSPSIEDSGPMMINQSIMCGTPVVAFNIGVALDLVITGKTGYLAKFGDSEDFAKGINQILNLDDIKYIKLSENCHKLGNELCYTKKQSLDFMNLFISN